jgi:hypothetical protein
MLHGSGTYQYKNATGICANTNIGLIEITVEYADGAI